MLQPGHRVGVAVSGGVDSVCLLHVLRELAGPLGLSLSVLHLNHRLRGADSDSDAAFVRDLADRLGLPFTSEEVDVLAFADNVEQAGRRARYSFYTRLIQSGVADRIATGHTRSDQAETVLYRLIRGSGTAGLAGIAPVTDAGIVRPLLDCNRQDVERFARERRLDWREDASNQDLRFVRNRIRHCLLPALELQYNPGLADILAGMSATARAEEQYWNLEVGRTFTRVARQHTGAVLIDVSALAAEHEALQRRLIRHAIAAVKGDLRSIAATHVEQVLTLARGAKGGGKVQIPGVYVQRSFNWLRFVKTGERAPEFDFAVEPPVRVPLGDRAAIYLDVVEFSALNADKRYNGVSFLDVDRLCGPLAVRNWRSGDRYSPRGSDEKIKHLFQRARIPEWERHAWPIVTSGGKIVWAKHFGADAGVAAGANTRYVLSIREEPGGFA